MLRVPTKDLPYQTVQFQMIAARMREIAQDEVITKEAKQTQLAAVRAMLIEMVDKNYSFYHIHILNQP